MSSTIEPFTVAVDDDVLADLRARIDKARWPDEIPGSGWDMGMDLGWLRSTAEYWRDAFDWRAVEDRLNSYDNGVTEIDGQHIHFMHIRSAHEDALPLIMTHGWPGSVVEFLDIIDLLVDPDDPADAFHLVIPSLPGYGWSSPPSERGWDVARTARAWAELMARLGYERYAAQGGDWGSFVTRHLATVDAEHLVGVHVNLYPGFSDDRDDLSEHEEKVLARSDEYMQTGNGYVAIQSTKPQCLAPALNDSPIGLLSWIGEKFHAWVDHDGDVFSALPIDTLLANVTVYWVTETIGSSMRMYQESLESFAVVPPPTGDVPLGIAQFPGEVLGSRKRWVDAEEGVDLRHWSEPERGGHFAAAEVPRLLAADVVTFFRDLR